MACLSKIGRPFLYLGGRMAKSKTTKTSGEKKKTSRTFESDIVKHLKSTKNANLDVEFLSENKQVDDWLDTNSYTWNYLSSGDLRKGLPYGRVIECHGDSYTGKSLLASQIAAMAQKDNAVVVYFDIEHGIDEGTIRKLGGDPDTIIAPDGVITVEDFNEAFVAVTKSVADSAKELGEKRPILVILDSLAQLSTKHEMEEPDKVDFSKAKKVRQFFRMYMHECAKNNILLFVINQVYEDPMNMFGPKKKTGGGQGLPYAASQRWNLMTPVLEKEGTTSIIDDVVATKVKAKTIKNRVPSSRPFRSGYIKFDYEHGIDRYGGLWDLLYDGDGGKVTCLKQIISVKRDPNDKTKWIPAKGSGNYAWPGVIVDEKGNDVGFTKKEFENVFKEKEEEYIDKLQQILDEKSSSLAPTMEDSLDEHEKVLAGLVDSQGEIKDDSTDLEKQIESLKDKSTE